MTRAATDSSRPSGPPPSPRTGRPDLAGRVKAMVTDDSQPPEVNLRRQVLAVISVLSALAGIGWGAVYFAFDEVVAAAIPWGYAVLSAASLAVARSRYFAYVTSQLLLMLLLPFLLQLSLGGFVPSSAVIVWGFVAPIGALLVCPPRAANALLIGFLALLVLAEVLQPGLGHDNGLPEVVVAVMFVLNLAGTAVVTFLAMRFFIRQRDQAAALLELERDRSERLLLNMLPLPIAARLKAAEQAIADRYDEVTVLFADIVDFTPLADRLAPEALVALLNETFSDFDDLTEARGLEKIRTIGDAYMVASGIPVARPDHAVVAVDLALAMLDSVRRRRPAGHRLTLRIGVASGPAVAGVIGRLKFQYDIWGDTVNTASRMQTHGISGRIQVTQRTYELVRDAYPCEPRGVVEVKGKGRMPTWLVADPIAAPTAGAAVSGSPRPAHGADVSRSGPDRNPPRP